MDTQALQSAISSDLRRIDIEQRWKLALDLRRAGYSYDHISEECGYASPESAAAAIRRALKRWGTSAAEDLRALELERLDEITRTLWPAVMAGDTESISLYLKVSERRAKLCGLDLTRQEVTHKGGGNQTMIVIGGDGQTYRRSLEEVERHIQSARNELPEKAESTPESFPMFGHVDADGVIIDVEDTNGEAQKIELG